MVSTFLRSTLIRPAISLSLCLAGFSFSQASLAEKISAERLYASPSIHGPSPRGLKISPDGSRVTFLQGKESDYERLDLWQYDLATGETSLLYDADDLHQGAENLSDEEKARRERMRLSATGIVDYQWSKDGKALLFPIAGDVFYYRLGADKAERLVNTESFETDFRLSPKGTYVSFIRDQNLVVKHIGSGREIAITTDGGGAFKYGMAEFVAQEEMSRMTGYWWSPDESKIALTRVDETPVELVTRSEIYADDIKTVTQRYPFAGAANADVRLGIATLKKDKASIRWLKTGKDRDIYLPRVQWSRDSNTLSYQWQSRDQQQLELRMVNANNGSTRTAIKENSDTWINLHDDLHFLADKKHFIWSSERDGFKHLYVHNMKGKQIRQLTSGDWVVDKLEAVDEKTGTVYFTGHRDSVLETQLYAVPIEGGDIRRISKRAGTHAISFSSNGERYIDSFSSVRQPKQVSLHEASGKHITWIEENKIDEEHPLFPYYDNWIEPEFGTLKASDGQTLYYRLHKPADFDPEQRYPVLFYPYGGPTHAKVRNRWGDVLAQYMAQNGYAVFTLDNRGIEGRGVKFQAPLYRKAGSIEIEDQVTGANFLKTKPWVDGDNIGFHGHSYGGYLTLMAMFRAGDVFKAGVSGAPVTDWRLYDTHYTERYMGNPATEAGNADYEAASVFPYIDGLQGELLIYHGMADDNVLFKNSTRLYKALQDKALPFMVMDYPGKKHSIRGKNTSRHRLEMIQRFFDLHLKR